MTTTQHKNIYVALAAAQAQFGAVTKGSVNPAFRTKYADLSDVVQAVAPALSSNGIAFLYCVEDGAMVTMLVHGESGTEVRCAIPLLVNKNDMQGFKSACTYAKRIGLESVTGVAPEDDDGNAATANPAPAQPPRAVQPSGHAVAQAKAKLRACSTMDDLKVAFIELKASAPDIARLDEIIQMKDDVKAAISVEVEAAQ